MSIELINVTFDASEINMSTKIMSITAFQMDTQNTIITCSKSLQPVETVQELFRFFSCNYICPKDSYSFSAGTMTLSGKYNMSTLENLSKNATPKICLSCPVGANCEKSITSLPNYWGYKGENDVVKMIRCPDKYCCSDPNTCTEIDIFHTGRTGPLCGICKDNLTESLFSPECIPTQNCSYYLFSIAYLFCILSYAAGL